MDESIKAIVKGGKYSKEQIKQIQTLYTKANRLFAEGKETFNTKFITGLLAGDSAGMTKTGLDISDAIFQNFIKAGKPSRVRALYELLENGVAKKIITQEAANQIKNKVQGQFILNVIGPNTDAVTGVINAKKVLEDISGFKGKGRGIIDALFKGNKESLGFFENYLKALNLAQKRGIGSMQGGLALFSGQVKSAAQIAGGGFGLGFVFSGGDVGSGTAVAAASPLLILGGPAIIARAFSNPKFVNGLMTMQMSKSGSNQYGRAFTTFLNSGLELGIFDYVNAGKVIQEQKLNGFITDEEIKKFPWLKDYMDETEEEIINPDVNNLQNFENDIKNTEQLDTEDTEDTELFSDQPASYLTEVNVEDINIPEPSSDIMANVIDSPVTLDASAPTTQSTPGPVGSSINPETQQKLESVGMPLFANQGGIASLMTQRKKPKQMVV